jgi:hypothetical protein
MLAQVSLLSLKASASLDRFSEDGEPAKRFDA